MWDNALESDDIFNEDESLVENASELVASPHTNSFIKIRYHWSEDPTKSEDWYLQQKRELNFNTRSVNQELDLIFIGSTNCIFDDDYLSNLQSKKPIDTIKLSHFCNLKLYSELDSNQYYLVGVDTAKSLNKLATLCSNTY